MKKKLLKKLTLSKETLRNLESSDLRDAVGGATQVCTRGILCSNACPNTLNTCGTFYC